MTVESETAASYMERAKLLRVMAGLDADKETAATLRKIALEYESMDASLTVLDAAIAKRRAP